MNFLFLVSKCLILFFFIPSKINSIDLINSRFVLNVNGNSHYLNFYYTTLFLGKEKENQTFLLDTTSSITTSPCNLCTSCGDHVNEYFKIKSNSSIIKSDSYKCASLTKSLNYSSKTINNYSYCNFFSNFEDNEEIEGIYINNLVSFEPITSKMNSEEDEENYISSNNEFELTIGCTLKETGGFQSRIADGVIGLNNNEKSLISMMYDMNIIKKNLFSLCFDEYGGYFSLGEIDIKYHINPNINYVKLYSNNDLYELEINSFIIDNNEMKNKYIAYIDSSSTISYFPIDTFNMMMAEFFSACADLEGECGEIKRKEGYGICAEFKDLNGLNNALNFAWPSIIIKFNDYDFIWKPKNYYMDFSSKKKIRACLGFESNKNIKNIILGTTFMHGYDIIFDRENNRIGFAEAACNRKISEKMNIINDKIKIEEERKKRETIKKENHKKILEAIKKEEEKRIKEIVQNKKKQNNSKVNMKKEIKKEKNLYEIYKERTYMLIFLVFIISIILTMLYYVSCNFNNSNIKDHTLIKNYKIEEKDINNIKNFGQIIEMINENENK